MPQETEKIMKCAYCGIRVWNPQFLGARPVHPDCWEQALHSLRQNAEYMKWWGCTVELPNSALMGGKTSVEPDKALLDDIHDALMECKSHDDGDDYPDSKLVRLGDVWAVLERFTRGPRK
ncbi:MAG: hypothetical protein JXN60_06155 [Lentisphaerae bacterium]|nr:hypothetical protein [Lentisphaerota bacterium]